MTKYKLIPVENGFQIIEKKNNEIVLIATSEYSTNCSPRISNTRSEILEMYRIKQIEKDAEKLYPVAIYGLIDYNHYKRQAHIEAIKSSKAKYTEEQMEKCFKESRKADIFCNDMGNKPKYKTFEDYIQSLQPKLDPVEVELEMEEITLPNEQRIENCFEGLQPKLNDKNEVTILKIV